MVNFLFPLKLSTVLHKAYFIFWEWILELASDGLQMFDIYKVEYIKQKYSHFAQRSRLAHFKPHHWPLSKNVLILGGNRVLIKWLGFLRVIEF